MEKALATLRTQAKAAGLKNPLLLVNGYRELAPSIEQGFDGFLPLNLAGIGLDGSQGNTADYSVYPKAWKDFVYKTYPKGSKSENYENYLLIPGGISGFDTRSWRGIGYGDHDGVEKSAYLNPSPDKFRFQAANVKDYLDTHPRSMNMATFYAWNEFGEGGAIEPTTQYGFGYVNALQETFHLDNSRYRTRVAKDGLENWDPALRLEFAPVQTSITKGAALLVKGKVTNQGSTAIRQGTVTLDAGAWKAKALSGTDLTGLKPGETRQVEFEAAAGDGEDWTKHELNISAAYETGGRKAVENTATFVVETPDVHGVIEPITGPVFGGDKLSLELNLIRYTSDAAAGHYRIEAPDGWSLSGRSEGSFSFTGKKPENGKALSAAAQLTIPKEVTDGSYPVTLVVSSQGRETRSSITLSVGNSLANPGFEKDKDKNGLADGWLAMTGKEVFELSGDRQDGSVAQKLTAQGFGAGIRQEWLALDPKKTYVVEAWVKVEAGTLNIAEAEADAGFKNFLGFTVQKQVNNRDWQKVSFTVKPKPGGVNGSIRFLSWSSGKTVAYIDHVVFRPAAD
ncbi:carbohydrate binding domain-containing protein [Paenibacillus sp. CC-CFT747]|nr:carbohydrate binding domain-containing protein [Paenibacillus sp. CC-CFT747]